MTFVRTNSGVIITDSGCPKLNISAENSNFQKVLDMLENGATYDEIADLVDYKRLVLSLNTNQVEVTTTKSNNLCVSFDLESLGDGASDAAERLFLKFLDVVSPTEDFPESKLEDAKSALKNLKTFKVKFLMN